MKSGQFMEEFPMRQSIFRLNLSENHLMLLKGHHSEEFQSVAIGCKVNFEINLLETIKSNGFSMLMFRAKKEKNKMKEIE